MLPFPYSGGKFSDVSEINSTTLVWRRRWRDYFLFFPLCSWMLCKLSTLHLPSSCLSVKVKALWDCECDGPQETALWASFCLEQPLTVDDRDNFRVTITSLITTLTEFTAGQMLVGVFLIHSGEIITWLSSVLLTVITEKKQAVRAWELSRNTFY